MSEKDELLSQIESEADDAVIMQKKVKQARAKKSELPLKFDITEDDDETALKIKLIKFINTKDLTYQDFFDFCYKYCETEKEGKTLAYNTIRALQEKRNIRADTIDILCRFLNVDIYVEEIQY